MSMPRASSWSAPTCAAAGAARGWWRRTLAAPPAWWDGRPFDRILLDAPCSATGVLRRHPDIRLLRRASDIGPLAELQRRALAAAFALLKSGGRLLSATCSILPEENAAVVDAFLAAEPAARRAAARGAAARGRGAAGRRRRAAAAGRGVRGWLLLCLPDAP
ncbi:MAG: hypothetical protein U1F06_05305 [Steroidobacteraceae bacterium]